jgi:Na+-translocating ferredoxin:NAD+ oxidoreductase RnfG subunit
MMQLETMQRILIQMILKLINMQIIILTFIALWVVAIITILFHFKKLQDEIKEEKKEATMEEIDNIISEALAAGQYPYDNMR